MRFVTFALTALSVASVGALLVLLGEWRWALLLRGVLLFACGVIVAPAAEHGAAWLRRVAARHVTGIAAVSGRRMFAILSGCLPMLAMIGYHYTTFVTLLRTDPSWLAGLGWLFAYGVAVGPWTLFAIVTDLQPKTLIGVHAYAGHLVFLILSLGVYRFAASAYLSLTLMVLVAVPPIVVGALVGLADPATLPKVRRLWR